MEKKETRRQVAKLITGLSREAMRSKSDAACRHLLAVPELQAARAIILYAPLPDEVDVLPALHAFAGAGKRIIMPKCRPETREVSCIEIHDFERDLVRGTFNILEPRSDETVDLSEVDAIVAPGRAFDREGNRIGRGVGYYDRFFIRPGFRAFKCGIAFDCQVFCCVTIEPHDIPVDAVVTESGRVPLGRGGCMRPK